MSLLEGVSARDGGDNTPPPSKCHPFGLSPLCPSTDTLQPTLSPVLCHPTPPPPPPAAGALCSCHPQTPVTHVPATLPLCLCHPISLSLCVLAFSVTPFPCHPVSSLPRHSIALSPPVLTSLVPPISLSPLSSPPCHPMSLSPCVLGVPSHSVSPNTLHRPHPVPRCPCVCPPQCPRYPIGQQPQLSPDARCSQRQPQLLPRLPQRRGHRVAVRRVPPPPGETVEKESKGRGGEVPFSAGPPPVPPLPGT